MGDEVTAGDGVPTRIVVGTDGSETAERAVWKATALAKAVGAELLVVSAYRNRAPAVPAAGVSLDSGWAAAARSAAEDHTNHAVESARSAGVRSASGRAVAGEPAEVLIKIVEDEQADLLVVGSKGMQSTARFLLGPIANRVSHKVNCDLLIVETSH
jgi:nucleotide-binding universal stress UspA family protein